MSLFYEINKIEWDEKGTKNNITKILHSWLNDLSAASARGLSLCTNTLQDENVNRMKNTYEPKNFAKAYKGSGAAAT